MTGRLRVAVVGAAGRMGAAACRAIAGVDDLDLVAAVHPGSAGRDLGDVLGDGVGAGITVDDDLAALAGRVDVAVELTRPPHGGPHALQLLDLGIHAVVGTTGIGDDELAAISQRADLGVANAAVVPNFALGAVLLLRFAEQAARHLPHVEILELHHDGKADAPSGTALRTAELVAGARGHAPEQVRGDEEHPGARGNWHHGVPVHSVRLPGLVAHQEVRFGGTGETLTLRHDSLDRSSFMPGILLAVRGMADRPGLTLGLDPFLTG
jgi:4-hydroxy-tetrahydrodipicolinate reductase